MNFLERLAHKPLPAVSKRSDGVEDEDVGRPPLEILHARFLEAWSHKGPEAGIPEWLASADSLGVHLDKVLSEFLGSEAGESGAAAGASAFAGEATAQVSPLEDMFGAVLTLAESPQADSPFAPITVDIPFAVG